MRRAYRFLLRPTSRQAVALAGMLADHRALYSAALQERRDGWRMRGVSVRYGDQSGQLKSIRAELPEQARWSFSSQQATLRRLDRAFQAFFRRVRAGQKPGYPRFKGRGWFDTVEWPKDGDGCRWLPECRRVRLQGIGHVRVHTHRAVQGVVKTVSVRREGRRWFLILSCDDVPAVPLPVTGAVVGVDVGSTHLLSTSDGVHVPNPKPRARSAARLTAAQRALARCERGSNRRRKTRARVAAIHADVRRQRLDYAHKTALALVRSYDMIAVETLLIPNMTRAPNPVPDPDRAGAWLPNGAAAKAGLNRSLLDAGWGVFLAVLRAKAESAGRAVVQVDPRNTSRTCSACGHCDGGNRDRETSRCLGCGHTDHADVNAAKNLLDRAGLVLHDAPAV